ncbi:glycosyltransferase family 2 protein [Patescibacteria group bacterium]|nr:glycosyltransferase family 2 protein [Patescibacteria group bacterium]
MIRLFIVTYNNPKALSENLHSLSNSDISQEDEIYIINNFGEIKERPKYSGLGALYILNNVCRPDFSHGFLSRSWNQSIILGFENLSNPACDIVCCVQDDTIFRPNWRQNLLKAHSKYSFIQVGTGDQFMSFTPDAIKKIGLFDERFSVLAFQEADYFTRAIIYNADQSSINDFPRHRRMHNHEEHFPTSFIVYPNTRISDAHEYRIVAMNSQNVQLCKSMWRHKWGSLPHEKWQQCNIWQLLPEHPICSSYIYYLFFEKHIENLEEKGYII